MDVSFIVNSDDLHYKRRISSLRNELNIDAIRVSTTADNADYIRNIAKQATIGFEQLSDGIRHIEVSIKLVFTFEFLDINGNLIDNENFPRLSPIVSTSVNIPLDDEPWVSIPFKYPVWAGYDRDEEYFQVCFGVGDM